MHKNTSIILGEYFDDFIARKIATLRRLLEEGESSGTAEYSYEMLMNELDDEIG